MPFDRNSAVVRYGAALFFSGSAISLRLALTPYLHHTSAFQILTVAVLLSALYGGVGPGLLAIVIGGFAAFFLFIEGGTTGDIDFHAEGLPLVLFITASIVLCLLIDGLRRARAQSESASEALRESEERFETAFSAAPYGMAIVDLKRRIFVEVNRQFAEIFGYDVPAFSGKAIDEFGLVVNPADIVAVQELIRQHKRVREFNFQGRKKSGEIVFLSISLEPIELLKVPMYLLTIQDITKRKQSEQELVLSERKYRAIVESTNAMLFTVDDHGRFTYVNDAAAVVLGYPVNELIGKFYLRYVIPGDRKWVHQTYLQQLRSARQYTYMEFRYLMASGREGWLSFSVSPVFRNGTIIGLSGVAQEITKRKQTEESLRFSERKHRMLFETMTQGAIYTTADGSVLDANPAALEIFGFTREQFVGRDALEIFQHVTGEDGSEIPHDRRPGITAAREGREVKNVRMRIFNPSKGKYVWIEVSSVPQFREGETEPYQVYSTFNDITMQKEAEDQIRKLNEELEERVVHRTEQLTALNSELESFSYSISHDLRAPLRAINGFSNILAEEHAPVLNEDARQLLRLIARNAKQMAQLIDDLLAFSRLSRESMEKREIPMKELVAGVIHEQRESEPERAVEVIIDDLPNACADPGLLRQVWINLVSNAFKFSRNKPHARIEIGFGKKGNETYYYIKDNGAGFGMEYCSKLFGVFQRLHTLDEFEGTGIGLALVQRIIRRHGGNIWAEAEVEQGATFYFTLGE